MNTDLTDCAYDVAYQGVRGAYSESAAQALLGPAARTLPSRGLEDVFESVAATRARFGVVPVENTIAGTVPRAYELLLDHDLRVVSETQVRIEHVLIGSGRMRREDVRRVLSHPVALGQCREFLRMNAHIEAVPVFDTAGAVEIVARERDGISAAIAGSHAAQVYGGTVLAERVQDEPENWTRFLLVGRNHEGSVVSGPGKVLLAFDLWHEPGALVHALQSFADAGLNLTKIESRPIPAKPFEYRFIVELTSTEGEAGLADAIAELRGRTVWLRVLGQYAATVEHAWRRS